MTLRNPETQEYWRGWAQCAAIVFFVRWLIQMRDFLRNDELDKKYKAVLKLAGTDDENIALV